MTSISRHRRFRHRRCWNCGIIFTDKNVGMPKKTSERDSLLNPGIMEGYA